MSLESGSFITQLVATNPEGTDPKSQGDDHLRLIKAVLKSQFFGFTDGISIILTESQLNRLGGVGAGGSALNIDTVVPYIAWIGVVGGVTGTFPPGAGLGDMVLNVCYNAGTLYQDYYCLSSKLKYHRVYTAGAWSAWVCMTPIGVLQAWLAQTGSRLFGDSYTNSTGRPMQVKVSGGAATATNSHMTVRINGVTISTTSVSDFQGGSFGQLINTVDFLVPAGASYSVVTTGGTVTLLSWYELR